MRVGKPTRLEREIHKRIVQQRAREWMAERGYRCPACGWAMADCVCVRRASGPVSDGGDE